MTRAAVGSDDHFKPDVICIVNTGAAPVSVPDLVAPPYEVLLTSGPLGVLGAPDQLPADTSAWIRTS